MPGGILFGCDWDRLVESARSVVDRFPAEDDLAFVEVGVDDGRTSRDLIDAIRAHGRGPELRECLGRPCEKSRFLYYGVDPRGRPDFHRQEYVHVKGLSHQVFLDHDRNDFVPISNSIHWCLIDGCHCSQCVARDAILYGSLIVPGGELLFHDASPRTQGLDPQTYDCMRGHHDEAEAAKGIQVRKFLDANLLAGFRLVQAAPDQDRGGVEVYRKI